MEPNSTEQLVLVDQEGREIGTSEKLAAHRGAGALHRAFSILIFNARGELLLQRRAACKYHFAGLWSNTCCGHPRPGEALLAAGERRLSEEFGLQVPLGECGRLVYRAEDVSSGLIEHEFLHVLFGFCSTESPHLDPDPLEIGDWAWRPLAELQTDLENSPVRYSPWLPQVLAQWAASKKQHLA